MPPDPTGSPAAPASPPPWWAGAVVYQLYLRSFQDSDGDGIGDLDGACRRLDALAELGVDTVWLSPIHPSPDRDFGYDVADHDAVHPRLGGMPAFTRFLAAARARGLRVLLDGVYNHSSDQHPWFQDSRQGPQAEKRDWYHWHRGAAPPNNWASTFGGPAWSRDPVCGDWYLHSFAPEQPDLNWAHPPVADAILASMERWLERGVAGFRLDVFNCYHKAPGLPDNPLRTDLVGRLARPVYPFIGQHHVHDRDQPALALVLRRMRALADRHGAVLVGETLDERLRYDNAAAHTGPDGLHLAFHFRWLHSPWSAAAFHGAIAAWSRDQTGDRWPTWVLGNHDFRRMASRWAGATAAETEERVRLALLMQLCLRGPAFVYQGDELGLRETPLARAQIQDPPGRRFWPLYRGRDGCRSPLPWTSAPGAGFSTAPPWLPLPPDHHSRNVEVQRHALGSPWRTLRALIALRRSTPALAVGAMALDPRDGGLLRWTRVHGDTVLTVLANVGRRPRVVALPGSTTLIAVNGARDCGAGILLPAHGGIVLAPV